MTRPRKPFVIGGFACLPLALVAFQGGGVHVPTEAVWALALGTLGIYLIWLGRMTLQNRIDMDKGFAKVLTLLEGDNGLLARMDSAEHEIATVDERDTVSRTFAIDKAAGAILNVEDNLTTRIERLENQLMKGAP